MTTIHDRILCPYGPDDLEEGSQFTNADRAAWALEAVQPFARMTGQHMIHDFQEVLADLICNILHLADETQATDSETVIRIAISHFNAEADALEYDDDFPNESTLKEDNRNRS